MLNLIMSRILKYQKRDHPNSSFCCVPECSVSGRYSALSFHRFPKDEALRRIWVRNVRRENLVINKSTTVCSRHFVTSDIIPGGRCRLKEGAVPVLFAWNQYTLPEGRPGVWQRTKRPEVGVEERPDPTTLLMCHNYNARPEPSASDLACAKIEALQLAMGELQRRSILHQVG